MGYPDTMIRVLSLAVWVLVLCAGDAGAQIKASVPSGAMTPAWDKGIQPISRESYWNAIECGKQGGARPACVFYDADLCKNDDFTLALFTPYKQVAYSVWQEVRARREPPTPSYADAQKTRVTIGINPAAGSKNLIAGLTIKRGGRPIAPATQSIDGAVGRFIFDFAPFAPTEPITLEMKGKTRTLTCEVPVSVLKILR